ncbi:hypothetical protein FACS1894184_19720 [Clostridia bacterium]|nr:hypothetical protein FACS1894184_19720 [Clostridia bacterium]
MTNQVKESTIVASIRNWLKAQPHCFFWKEHGGKFGTAGLPDLIVCYNGRFVAFEVKTPTGILSELQKITMQRIRETGGIAERVTSLAEVKQIIAGITPRADI